MDGIHDMGGYHGFGPVDRFSANLRAAGNAPGLEAYFAVWMETFLRIMADKSGIAEAQVSEMAEHWRRSYLATPHGQPITLCLTLPPRSHAPHPHHHHHHHHHAVPAHRPVFVDQAQQV